MSQDIFPGTLIVSFVPGEGWKYFVTHHRPDRSYETCWGYCCTEESAWRLGQDYLTSRSRPLPPSPTPPVTLTVEECRRQMSRCHPDHGGDAAEFRLWHARHLEAKAREERA